ncbi:GNAT family N-acetyltransferase [Lentilactobacillus kosonis]|uniref:Ribosomal-protein-l7p-serine acetyltransferase n=1 Tax=Lentilactobacillus kosonis TaxID=2810561 RepID=A0A401FIL8_9LACO|nr:GNAT family protein [Lentilactobacillus kosonis]GAY72177.1 ribosomal-protein-l7p-serine acetyltransferase [Lentilactobacillus kosonis]
MFIHQVNATIALKLPSVNDAAALYDLVDTDRREFARWLPWTEQMMSVQDEAAFLDYGIKQMAEGKFWFSIILVEGEVAGMIDIHSIDTEYHRGEVGYWLSTRYQGNGAVTTALAAIEDIAFNELGIHRLELLAVTTNTKSRAVAERRFSIKMLF